MAVRSKAFVTTARIEQSILLLRGQKVLLGSTLAELYGVLPKVLMQAVQRNRLRFPADFMFRLENHEVANLKSQIVTSSWRSQDQSVGT